MGRDEADPDGLGAGYLSMEELVTGMWKVELDF